MDKKETPSKPLSLLSSKLPHGNVIQSESSFIPISSDANITSYAEPKTGSKSKQSDLLLSPKRLHLDEATHKELNIKDATDRLGSTEIQSSMSKELISSSHIDVKSTLYKIQTSKDRIQNLITNKNPVALVDKLQNVSKIPDFRFDQMGRQRLNSLMLTVTGVNTTSSQYERDPVTGKFVKSALTCDELKNNGNDSINDWRNKMNLSALIGVVNSFLTLTSGILAGISLYDLLNLISLTADEKRIRVLYCSGPNMFYSLFLSIGVTGTAFNSFNQGEGKKFGISFSLLFVNGLSLLLSLFISRLQFRLEKICIIGDQDDIFRNQWTKLSCIRSTLCISYWIFHCCRNMKVK